jgi:stalled ribosome alternative rescue factor ArfA
VDRAVITDNLFIGPVEIANKSKGSVQIANNVAKPAGSGRGNNGKQRSAKQ